MFAKKYFLVLGLIFMFCTAFHIYAGTDDAQETAGAMAINKVLKQLKTSGEMIELLSVKLGISKEELTQNIASPETLGRYFAMSAEQIKKLSPEILETMKKQTILLGSCVMMMQTISPDNEYAAMGCVME